MKGPHVKRRAPSKPPATDFRLPPKPVATPRVRLLPSVPPVAIGARLRHARLVKGLLIKDLAARVGVSNSLIAKYKNDRVSPPLTILHSLVTALRTNICALFEARSGRDSVARAGSRPLLATAGVGESVGSHARAAGAELLDEGDEVGYVLEGHLRLTVGDVTHELCAGDSFVFPSNLAHTYRNLGTKVTRVLWVDTPPTF